MEEVGGAAGTVVKREVAEWWAVYSSKTVEIKSQDTLVTLMPGFTLTASNEYEMDTSKHIDGGGKSVSFQICR
jgi:hypothetical protein